MARSAFPRRQGFAETSGRLSPSSATGPVVTAVKASARTDAAFRARDFAEEQQSQYGS